MDDTLSSLQKQLTEAEENLRLIQSCISTSVATFAGGVTTDGEIYDMEGSAPCIVYFYIRGYHPWQPSVVTCCEEKTTWAKTKANYSTPT